MPDLIERLERLRNEKVFAKQIEGGYLLSPADRRTLAEAIKALAELRDERDEARAALEEALHDDRDKWSFDTLLAVGDALLAGVYPEDIFPQHDREEGDPGPRLVRALRACRAALSPDQGTRAGTSGPLKSADTCPTCGSDDPAIDPSGAEYAPCDDPFHDRSGSEIPPMARCPQCGAVKLSEQECPRCAGTGASLAESDTCPSCGSDDPNTRLVAPRGGDEGSTRYYCIDPFHGCTCEPTGECMHSMSGPTCFIPGCPPCQHPELDTDPRCPVHGESVTAEQEAGE